MRNDDETTATLDTMETESFAQVRGGGKPLSMTASPRYGTIGLEAKNANPSLLSARTIGNLIKSTELCFSMVAGEIPESEEARAPVDVIVALDHSGSMNCGKLDLCKKTLGILLRQLLPQDRFGLIVYADEASIKVPIQRMTPEHKAAAIKAIASVQAWGGTNISSAVGLSAQEMRTVDSPNPVQTVFLLTDGQANSGICTQDGLAKLVKNCYSVAPISAATMEFDLALFSAISCEQQQQQQKQKNQKNQQQKQQQQTVVLDSPETEAPTKRSDRPVSAISLQTFGYGADHNGALLREMASASTGGSYYFIEEDKDVGSAFGDALGGVLSVVAQNATVTLHVPPAAKARGVTIQQVHHDQAIRRNDGSYTVTMGDFFAEETRDLIVTVTLASPDDDAGDRHHNHNNHGPAPIPHAFATLSYTDTIESRLVQTETVVVSISRPPGEQLSEENPHVVEQCFRVFATQKMADAEKLASVGQFRQAKDTFSSIQTEYAKCSAAVQASHVASGLFSDASVLATTMDDPRSYATSGQATVNARMYSHKNQRATETYVQGTIGKTAYGRSKKRADYSSAFSAGH